MLLAPPSKYIHKPNISYHFHWFSPSSYLTWNSEITTWLLSLLPCGLFLTSSQINHLSSQALQWLPTLGRPLHNRSLVTLFFLQAPKALLESTSGSCLICTMNTDSYQSYVFHISLSCFSYYELSLNHVYDFPFNLTLQATTSPLLSGLSSVMIHTFKIICMTLPVIEIMCGRYKNKHISTKWTCIT